MEESERLYQESLSLFRSGKLGQAISNLERTLQLTPQFIDALEALGVCYAKANRLDDAIDAMKRLVKASPNHIMAHTNLSRFYVEKGLIFEAEQEQAEARRLSWKEELKAQKLSGELKEKSPEEEARDQEAELENRIARYKKVIELDSNDVLGYFSLGTAYTDGKRFGLAEETFKKAVTVDSKHSPSYFSLGVVLEALGKKNEAAEIYEKGIPIADERGDIIPLRKMQARLHAIRSQI